MASKRYAKVEAYCVACGTCLRVCPKEAISIWKGVEAHIDKEKCVGCGKCEKECPAGAIGFVEREGSR